MFGGGLLAEVALILAIVPLGLHLGENFLHYSAPPGSFVMCFLGTLIGTWPEAICGCIDNFAI